MFRKPKDLPYEYKGAVLLDERTKEVSGERYDAYQEFDVEGCLVEEGWIAPSGTRETRPDNGESTDTLWPSDVARIVADLRRGFEPEDVVFARHLKTEEPLDEEDVNRIVAVGLSQRSDWEQASQRLFVYVGPEVEPPGRRGGYTD